MSDDRRKVNDVSECLCGSGALMVSVGNVNVVAVSNWDDAEGSEATSTRKECGEREVKIIRKEGRKREEGGEEGTLRTTIVTSLEYRTQLDGVGWEDGEDRKRASNGEQVNSERAH
jgi:hypothetical protein